MTASFLAATKAADLAPTHFGFAIEDRVATITLDRPERKNPLTFESYGELGRTFRALAGADDDDVKAVVITGAGGNFSSGGDVHEIIGPLTEMTMPELLAFTRMTGEAMNAIMAAPQVVIAAIDGICAGAGACLAMASDMRYGTPERAVGFLFSRVGLAGCDMGACAILPRIIGQGRAAELLYTGRMMTADEAAAWGFVNGGAKLVHPGGAKLVHLTLCGTRCWGVVPVVHRRDPRCFVSRLRYAERSSVGGSCGPTGSTIAPAVKQVFLGISAVFGFG